MTRIPVVTQNFSSPDVLTDSPLMLLPQPPALNTLIDRDQEGFSQLLLHDLHRHRQSYVRSYTAFETLKKRQDFVLRQENLRTLQYLEQRVIHKQEQSIDQSLHSYEQCFVKVINPNQSSSTGSHHHPYPETLKATKNNGTSFDKHHIYPLSHTPAMPLDPPAITPFHRYQKSHRPRVTAKYRTQSAIQRTALCLHDAFQSSNHSHQSPPFVSFTESYLQKYAERSSARFTINSNIEKSDDEVVNIIDPEDSLQQRSTHSMDGRSATQPERTSDLHKLKSTDAQRVRATVLSRNTNTPSTTPQMHYQDAVRDGLDYGQNHQNERRSSLTEQRRLSQQSSDKSSYTINHTNVNRRPKTAKKKSTSRAEPLTPARNDVVTGVAQENDILRQSMFVQNYGNNVPDSVISTKTERSTVTSTVRITPLKKTNGTISHTPSPLNDLNANGQSPVNMSESKIPSTPENLIEPSRNSPLPETKATETPTPESQPEVVVEKLNPTEPIPTVPAESKPELIDPRKRIRNSLFDQSESIKDLMSFELDLVTRSRGTMKKTRFDLNGKGSSKLDADNGTVTVKDNQGTLDLLEKIRSGVVPVSIGQHPLSQRNCRFELPYDLKILETLTPLQYLSKYCRLSSRRTYHFKRIFDKYRNSQYRFESTELYRSILDVHSDNFTRTHYDQLVQLIDLGNEQHQFAFDTFSGILALCERVLCDSDEYRHRLDEYDLSKDTIEKCDFDSLERKLDGLNVSDTMKKLLRAL